MESTATQKAVKKNKIRRELHLNEDGMIQQVQAVHCNQISLIIAHRKEKNQSVTSR